ncbi:MAG: hypothetical protein M1816_005442 [Peltula sp. TS41687]|nr:MAG: hypothetical protein M1816_005442 [Peltula sp. TS41687]
MSFFGFDTTLPRDRGRSTETASFFQPPDPFAGICRPGPSDGNNDDDAVDFEDTYDGLGDQLDDADDALNDDTFGGQEGGEPATQASVGKDYDFFGQTAQVSDAINEEHLRYNRNAPPLRPSAVTESNYVKSTSKSVRTGYEQYKDRGSIPDLQVDASLWGVAPKKQGGESSQQVQQPRASDQTTVVPPKKMMSLEEVEAAMLSQRKPPPVPERPIFQPPIHIHQTTAEPPVPVQILQPEFRRPPPQEPRPPQSIHPAMGGPQQSMSYHQRDPSQSNGPSQPATLQPRQILQNPNRHPVQTNQAQVRGLEPKPPLMHQASGPLGGFIPQPPLFAHPQQPTHLTEEQRAAFMEEEAKRAKRNHKIHLLSKDNGLMTPQDKNFITRIQLQQLVTATGNPNEQGTDAALVEDFYYQVHSQIRGGPRQNPHQPLNSFAQTYLYQTGARQGGAVGRRLLRGGDSHVQRMEQQVQRAVEAAKLKPKNKQLVVEGSLGKISFSNAKTPKPLLNFKRTESGQDVHRPQSAGRTMSERKVPQTAMTAGDKKTVLRQIEKVYLILMEMEDHERRMPPQPSGADDSSALQQHMEWTQKMQESNKKLWTELRVMDPIIPNSPEPHPFIAFLSYAKGKKAVPRIFRQIDAEQRVTILTMIVVHIGILDVVRQAQLQPNEHQLPSAIREEVEIFSQAVMPSLFGYVNEAPLHIVIGLLGILLDSSDVQLVARTKVGLAILTMFLSRAELVKQASTGAVLNEDEWAHWTALYGRLFDSLEPILGHIFPGSVNAGEDIYVWQFLAAIGLGAGQDQQHRLVMAVKDRVMETVGLSKTLPPDMASQRLANVNLFLRAIGLDVQDLLQ